MSRSGVRSPDHRIHPMRRSRGRCRPALKTLPAAQARTHSITGSSRCAVGAGGARSSSTLRSATTRRAALIGDRRHSRALADGSEISVQRTREPRWMTRFSNDPSGVAPTTVGASWVLLLLAAVVAPSSALGSAVSPLARSMVTPDKRSTQRSNGTTRSGPCEGSSRSLPAASTRAPAAARPATRIVRRIDKHGQDDFAIFDL